MANVKQVEIKGHAPFNIAENEDACKVLGMLNGPAFGLRIQWNLKAISYIPNEFGGKTALYGFVISGQEALRTEKIDWMVNMLKRGGAKVEKKKVIDLEA